MKISSCLTCLLTYNTQFVLCVQSGLWLDRRDGLNGMSDNDNLFDSEGLTAAQNCLIAGLVMLSILNIGFVVQLGMSLAPHWPSKAAASSSVGVGIQVASA